MARFRTWITIVLAALLSSLALGQQSATDRNIAHYQARAAASNSAADYDKLGAAYIQKGRETSEFDYYELAEKALAKTVELESAMDLSAATVKNEWMFARAWLHRAMTGEAAGDGSGGGGGVAGGAGSRT